MQYSTAIRDAQNNQVEATAGTAVIARVYNGSMPANCAAALSGNTLLAEGSLPSDWLTASSSGVISKNGTWTLTGQAGASTGTAGTFFRIYESGGSTCHIQGTFGAGSDMVPDNNNIANAQTVTITQFDVTRGNA